MTPQEWTSAVLCGALLLWGAIVVVRSFLRAVHDALDLRRRPPSPPPWVNEDALSAEEKLDEVFRAFCDNVRSSPTSTQPKEILALLQRRGFIDVIVKLTPKGIAKFEELTGRDAG